MVKNENGITGFFLSFISPEASSFWEIQRAFLENTLDFTSMQNILYIAGGAVGAILLAMLILRLRPKKKYVPEDWLLDPKEIRDALETALAQRSKFELQFSLDDTVRRPALRCAAYEVHNRSITFEASGLTTISRQWTGRKVDCFFMLRKRERLLFYAFTSTIAGVSTSNNVCFIRVDIPERVETRQKRSYLRIAPPEEYLLGAAVWRGAEMPEDAEQADLSLWKAPSLIWLPGSREDFTVRDVSSGGMRLHLPRQTLVDETDLVHVSTRFIVMLDLWDPDKALRLRFWVLCRMQSPVLDFETKGMDLGAQFLAWAKPARPGESSLLWLKLASSGEVEPLGNWIMRRHLEYFRENEQYAAISIRETGGEEIPNQS